MSIKAQIENLEKFNRGFEGFLKEHEEILESLPVCEISDLSLRECNDFLTRFFILLHNHNRLTEDILKSVLSFIQKSKGLLLGNYASDTYKKDVYAKKTIDSKQIFEIIINLLRPDVWSDFEVRLKFFYKRAGFWSLGIFREYIDDYNSVPIKYEDREKWEELNKEIEMVAAELIEELGYEPEAVDFCGEYSLRGGGGLCRMVKM